MRTLDLAVGDVYPNPDQPRKTFDRESLEELGASLKERQLQAILVRPDGSGRWIIVGGERRWRAAQIAGLATIRATIADDMTDDEMADAAIVENLQRKDITPLEEARAFQRRLDAGLTPTELAKRLGLRDAYRITYRTALLRLTEPMQVALAAGILTTHQAFYLSKLSPANQKVLFDAIGEGRCTAGAELRRTADALLASEQQVGMFAAEAPPTKEEKDRATALERAIDAAAKAVGKGFDGNDCVALKRVAPLKADVLVEQIALIERALKEIRVSLAAACVAGRKAA